MTKYDAAWAKAEAAKRARMAETGMYGFEDERANCGVGLVVSVERMEKGTGAHHAHTALQREFQMQTFAIVTIVEIAEFLREREVDGNVVLTADFVREDSGLSRAIWRRVLSHV